MVDHKLVCWDDYAIPVPNEANWIAWDKNGDLYWYAKKPVTWETVWGSDFSDYGRVSNYSIHLAPPEPGPWTKQLYWIGDDD